MVAHTGVCLVHRAEIMQLQGAWDAALEEARRAGERFAEGMLNERVCGKAYYRQGEVHRLRGELSCGRGGIPGGKPARVGATAWPGPAAPGGRERRRGVRSDQPGGG